MNSIETINVASVPAFTIQYTGTGTGTLTHASHVITMARANVNAFTLTYTGSASTCTVAQDADTLTIARTEENAFSLVYTGEEATATVTVAANTLTYQIGEAEPVALDLTNASYNTIAKVVAALDAVEGLTCTLATGAVNTNTGITLNNLTATSIKTALNLKYTPANLTWDLTNASYNTLTKIVAALDALDLYTCTLAIGAVGTDASALLDALEAASIKTAKTLTYSYADVQLDTSNASYNTVTEVIEALDALNGVTTSAETTTFLTMDAIKINEFEATNIATALAVTIDTGEPTTSFLPIGAEIRVEGTQYLAIYATVDINDTQNMRLKATARLESGGTDYVIDHSQILYSRDSVAADKSYIEIANDEDQNLMWLIPIYGYSHIQMWMSAGTVGASFGKITALSYQNIKGVPL